MRGRIDRPKYNGLGSGGGRHRFDGPVGLDRGGVFGYNVQMIPRNDLPTSVAEPGVVAVT